MSRPELTDFAKQCLFRDALDERAPRRLSLSWALDDDPIQDIAYCWGRFRWSEMSHENAIKYGRWVHPDIAAMHLGQYDEEDVYCRDPDGFICITHFPPTLANVDLHIEYLVRGVQASYYRAQGIDRARSRLRRDADAVVKKREAEAQESDRVARSCELASDRNMARARKVIDRLGKRIDALAKAWPIGGVPVHDGFYVYQLRDATGSVFYVGQSTRLVQRIGSHQSTYGSRIADVTVFGCETKQHMCDLESVLISELQPPENKAGKRVRDSLIPVSDWGTIRKGEAA